MLQRRLGLGQAQGTQWRPNCCGSTPGCSSFAVGTGWQCRVDSLHGMPTTRNTAPKQERWLQGGDRYAKKMTKGRWININNHACSGKGLMRPTGGYNDEPTRALQVVEIRWVVLVTSLRIHSEGGQVLDSWM